MNATSELPTSYTEMTPSDVVTLQKWLALPQAQLLIKLLKGKQIGAMMSAGVTMCQAVDDPNLVAKAEDYARSFHLLSDFEGLLINAAQGYFGGDKGDIFQYIVPA